LRCGVDWCIIFPMRRVAIYPALLALLLAFFMAPYQHVHPAQGHERETGRGDDWPTVHVHPYAISLPVESHSGNPVGVSHIGHDAWFLDSFTVSTYQATSVPFVQTESPIKPFVLPKSPVAVEIVETRGHDPPQLALSVPRSPPA
jgi:hypothetical protein